MVDIAGKVREKNGGGPGIRTPGRLLTFGGFQDRCIQPLCQPTVFPFATVATAVSMIPELPVLSTLCIKPAVFFNINGF